METAELVQHFEYWSNQVLVWVGFGTIVGLMAKAIMPGRDPGGAIATLAMGIGGTLIGCGLVAYFWVGFRVTPIHPLGFAAGTLGALLILFFYRLLAGHWFLEGERRAVRRPSLPRRRRRRYESAHLED